jgi:hypothetical protein
MASTRAKTARPLVPRKTRRDQQVVKRITVRDVLEAVLDLREYVQAGFIRIEDRLEQHDRRFDRVDATLERMEHRADRHEDRISALEDRG